MNNATHLHRWDIFCRVVDNLGDAGVCWRLARQLALEHGISARLWIDHLPSLSRLAPAVDDCADFQMHEGVSIRRWDARIATDTFELGVGEVVIEAFGCDPPQEFLAAMARRHPPPVWLNLEYLSAEPWVAEHHGLPSPHPRLPLLKHFFFPGFTANTGGLLRERKLLSERDAFQSDPVAQDAFMAALGVPPGAPEALRVSMFCYRSNRLPQLLEAWARGSRPVQCIVPQGQADAAVSAFLGQDLPWRNAQRGQVQLACIPFLPQDDYDRLLWACDCNFVRGEDSFVRAQWAARPMVWQAYPQTDDAHLVKTEAFLARYSDGLPPQLSADLRALWLSWSGGGDIATTWSNYLDRLPRLAMHSRRWSREQARIDDLASQLLRFCQTRI